MTAASEDASGDAAAPAVLNQGENRIRIAIFDDHPMMRQGLVATFGNETDMEVVRAGASADHALHAALDAQPELIVIDLDMPGDGMQALRRLRAKGCEVKVIILTVHDDILSINRAFEAGAQGFVSKGVSGSQLVDAARRVAAGERFVTILPRRAEAESANNAGRADGAMVSLAEKERRVIESALRGGSGHHVAHELGVELGRIKSILANLILKSRIRKRLQAVVRLLTSRR